MGHAYRHEDGIRVLMSVVTQWTAAIGREVKLRTHTMDRQVWADTFTGLYHVPPLTIPPCTVLDLGANIGLTAAHYQYMWPESKIVAIEMDSDCAALARENAPGVTVFEHAVSGVDDMGFYNPDVRSDSYAVGSPDGVLVITHTLSTTIDMAGMDYVDFVKMDIEGTEWDVFADGSWAADVGAILVELHGDGGSRELVRRGVAALQALGFNASHYRRHPQAVWAWR